MTRRLRILHTVEFFHPSKGGAQEVVRQLSVRLAALGHEVTVATTRLPERASCDLDGVRIEEFAISGNEVRGFQGETDRYVALVTRGGFDIVMNYAAQQWATDLCLAALEQIPARKVLVPCGFSGLFRPEYRDYFRAMPDRMRRYDACVFLSTDYRDIEFARAHDVPDIVVIPNGCGADEFSQAGAGDIRARLGIPADDFLVLHVGGHTGLKGHGQLFDIFVRSGLRRATLLLVGNDVPHGCGPACRRRARTIGPSLRGRWRGIRALAADLDRADTVAAYHAADLFLFPSNVECSPLVLFEALASRTPFLTTDAGNAREIIAWSGGGELLPTRHDGEGLARARIGGSARLLRQAWRDPARRAALADAGHRAWRARFTWERIVSEYERLYLRLVDEV